MSYAINIEIDGFEFQFGDMGHFNKGIGTYINFYNPAIKIAIEKDDPKFFIALKKLFKQSEEFDSLYTLTNFEYYYLQGNGWSSLMQDYSFDNLENFKRQANIVLNSKHATNDQLINAQTILDVLSGNYKFPPEPEKSPEEKAKSAFDRKKDKIRLKLVIRDGYKCHDCGQDKENSLCIIQKEKDPLNYELENLHLKCRRCMRINK